MVAWRGRPIKTLDITEAEIALSTIYPSKVDVSNRGAVEGELLIFLPCIVRLSCAHSCAGPWDVCPSDVIFRLTTGEAQKLTENLVKTQDFFSNKERLQM